MADPILRMLVALRRDLPDPVRDTLVRDCGTKVLKAIAPHPRLCEAQLLAMIDRHGPRAAAKAATNPNATVVVLERLTLINQLPQRDGHRAGHGALADLTQQEAHPNPR